MCLNEAELGRVNALTTPAARSNVEAIAEKYIRILDSNSEVEEMMAGVAAAAD